MVLKHISTIAILMLATLAYAQVDDIDVDGIKDRFQINIKKATGPIIVDGKLDEASWNIAEVATDFWQKAPFVIPNADPKTEIRLSYDDQKLYLAAKVYQTERRFIHTLRRDEYWDSDGVAVVLDPINAKSTAYIFGCTAAGVQMDAIRADGSDMNRDWSNKWYAEVDQNDGYWTAEIAIPFKVLKFKKGQKKWGINFIRNNKHENEFHCWTSVPVQNWPVEAAYAGTLIWDEAPVPPKGNFNIIPYVTSSITSQVDEKTQWDGDIGVDARVALSPTLNMDFTVNPDFSQIEVDELVTNLSRFNIFLPEKRTFFLENGDIFGSYGYGFATPFFSRTIGLTEDGSAVPILYGARLTGNLRNSTRIGVMNIHSLGNEDSPGQNQSAVSVQENFGRSLIRAMVLNRQAFDGNDAIGGDYGRNLSIESKYVTNDARFSAWGGYHKSFKRGFEDKDQYFRAGAEYSGTNWQIYHDNAWIGENYFADMGFIGRIENYDAERDTTIRRGFYQGYTGVTYRIRPTSGAINQHVFNTEFELVLNDDGTLNERNISLSYGLNFKNTQRLRFSANHNQINLLYPFSFTSEGENLPVGEYRFVDGSINYQSDERKALYYEIELRGGQFYNGNIKRLATQLRYRIQPWGNFSVGYQYNDIQFPEPYGSRTISALVSKIEIGFSRNLIWTTLFQYVDQADFMGINSRLQYRFSPMSDLFLVYIDNYDILDNTMMGSSISNNNRALVLKASYWY